MEKKAIVCARCGAQLRVPGDIPKLKVACPKCSYIFIHTNGEPFHNTQRGNDTVNSYYSGSSGGLRHIVIRRPGHVQKTATNIIMDAKPEFVYLDGKNMGVLKTGGTVDIDIDTASHKLKTGTPGSACVLPAGTDNYFAEFHNGTFEIGIANDPFAAALLPVILNIFRGQGVLDRMQERNNLHHNVMLRLDETGIGICWHCAKPHGFKQWANGTDGETISFYQAGVTPPPKERQPRGYWACLTREMEHQIEQDREANLQRDSHGGFVPRYRSSLY